MYSAPGQMWGPEKAMGLEKVMVRERAPGRARVMVRERVQGPKKV